MSRVLTDHKTNPANEQTTIEVLDDPDHLAGGACHLYLITVPQNTKNPETMNGLAVLVPFQHGAISEVGVNGITNEGLLAVVIDRLRSFQVGNYQCRENALALTKLEESLMWLQARTRARTARGVEGTSKL
jgi:hypothetical protein